MQGKKQQLEPYMEQLFGLSLGKEYNRAVCCYPAEYIMRNAGLHELQPRIKIGERSMNNLRKSNDTTLMAENKEELKILLMRVKEEDERAGLSLSIKKEMKLRPWHPVPLLHGK